jgi:RND family efflux transporter MFP subunit
MSEQMTKTQARTRRHSPARRIATLLAIGAVLALGTSLWTQSFPGASPVAAAEAASAEEKAKDGDEKEKAAAAVAVTPVEQGEISAYITATANLVAEDEVKVVAEADGKVVELLVREGDRVRKGQKLLQIDPGDAALAVRKAELALQNTSLSLERSEKMAADELISPQDLDRIRYERDVAEHELDEARFRHAKTTVVAPFSGTITLRSVQMGQTLKPGDELFTLADFEPLVARIFLPEREVLDLRVGQDAQLSLKAREELRFRGRIRQISPVVDTASGTVKVTVEAVAPPSSVRPGAFVSVGIVRETHQNALLIPCPAVIRELQETYVYVADGEVARKRPVALGLEEGDSMEITSGLEPGDLVVTSGQGALKDNAPIKVADEGSADTAES